MSQIPTSATIDALSPELIARFGAIVGAQHALADPDQQLPYLREWRDMYPGRASLVLRPGSTGEVSRVLALANEHAIHPRRGLIRGIASAVGGESVRRCPDLLQFSFSDRSSGGDVVEQWIQAYEPGLR